LNALKVGKTRIHSGKEFQYFGARIGTLLVLQDF